MIIQERIDELQEYFWSESNDEETREWRYELTVEEEKLVDKWDSDYNKGVSGICLHLRIEPFSMKGD